MAVALLVQVLPRRLNNAGASGEAIWRCRVNIVPVCLRSLSCARIYINPAIQDIEAVAPANSPQRGMGIDLHVDDMTQTSWAASQEETGADAAAAAGQWATSTAMLGLAIADTTTIRPEGTAAKIVHARLREHGVKTKMSKRGVDRGVGTLAGKRKKGDVTRS